MFAYRIVSKLIPILLFLCLLLQASTAFAHPQVDVETKTVANLIYKLALYVSWPEVRSEEFTVCMLRDGSSEFSIPAHMRSKIFGRKIQFQFPGPDTNQISNCDIFYFGMSSVADKNAERYIRLYQNKSVLTIGALPRFLERGGAIGLVNNNGAIGIEVNMSALRKAGLVMNPSALENARRVVQ